MEVMLGERRQKSRLVISPLSLVTPGACETVCNTRNTSQLIDQIPGFHHMISYIVKLLFIDLSLRNGAFSFVPQNFDTNYNDNKDKNRKKKVIIITIRKRLSRHTHKMEALVLSRRKWGRQLGSQSNKAVHGTKSTPLRKETITQHFWYWREFHRSDRGYCCINTLHFTLVRHAHKATTKRRNKNFPLWSSSNFEVFVAGRYLYIPEIFQVYRYRTT